MTLERWSENRWLQPHRTSSEEVRNLLAIVERDVRDASEPNLSLDWKFGIAYNAALKLCTVLLYASGYRAYGNLAHYRTIHAVKLILGDKRKGDVIYLDVCRKKRNVVEYDCAGAATEPSRTR